MPRKTADQRRVEFIDAAVRVIAKQGLGDATTRRIAEEANAPLASLHYCFQTKEKLLWAVWERFMDDFASSYITGLTDETLSSRAAAVLDAGHRWLLDHPDFTLASFDIYQWALRRDDSPFDTDLNDLFATQLADALRPAARPDEQDVVMPLARLILAMLDGFSLGWNYHQDEDRFRSDMAVARTAVEAFLSSSRERVGVR